MICGKVVSVKLRITPGMVSNTNNVFTDFIFGPFKDRNELKAFMGKLEKQVEIVGISKLDYAEYVLTNEGLKI